MVRNKKKYFWPSDSTHGTFETFKNLPNKQISGFFYLNLVEYDGTNFSEKKGQFLKKYRNI
jgi:hypothetical protein